MMARKPAGEVSPAVFEDRLLEGSRGGTDGLPPSAKRALARESHPTNRLAACAGSRRAAESKHEEIENRRNKNTACWLREGNLAGQRLEAARTTPCR